jgi:hypothetical protein
MYEEMQKSNEPNGTGLSSRYVDRYDNPMTKTDTRAIPQAYNNLTLNLEAVQKCVAELEDRLSGVLSAESPTPANGVAESRDVTCGLAQSIQDDSERLCSAARRLQSILSRLEL